MCPNTNINTNICMDILSHLRSHFRSKPGGYSKAKESSGMLKSFRNVHLRQPQIKGPIIVHACYKMTHPGMWTNLWMYLLKFQTEVISQLWIFMMYLVILYEVKDTLKLKSEHGSHEKDWKSDYFPTEYRILLRIKSYFLRANLKQNKTKLKHEQNTHWIWFLDNLLLCEYRVPPTSSYNPINVVSPAHIWHFFVLV